MSRSRMGRGTWVTSSAGLRSWRWLGWRRVLTRATFVDWRRLEASIPSEVSETLRATNRAGRGARSFFGEILFLLGLYRAEGAESADDTRASKCDGASR